MCSDSPACQARRCVSLWLFGEPTAAAGDGGREKAYPGRIWQPPATLAQQTASAPSAGPPLRAATSLQPQPLQRQPPTTPLTMQGQPASAVACAAAPLAARPQAHLCSQATSFACMANTQVSQSFANDCAAATLAFLCMACSRCGMPPPLLRSSTAAQLLRSLRCTVACCIVASPNEAGSHDPIAIVADHRCCLRRQAEAQNGAGQQAQEFELSVRTPDLNLTDWEVMWSRPNKFACQPGEEGEIF